MRHDTHPGQREATIITLHHKAYRARAYFAIAETEKLKRFYDRVLQHPPRDEMYEVKAKEEEVMYSTHDISTLKKMTVAERKAEAMRQLKESFDLAER